MHRIKFVALIHKPLEDRLLDVVSDTVEAVVVEDLVGRVLMVVVCSESFDTKDELSGVIVVDVCVTTPLVVVVTSVARVVVVVPIIGCVLVVMPTGCVLVSVSRIVAIVVVEHADGFRVVRDDVDAAVVTLVRL